MFVSIRHLLFAAGAVPALSYSISAKARNHQGDDDLVFGWPETTPSPAGGAQPQMLMRESGAAAYLQGMQANASFNETYNTSANLTDDNETEPEPAPYTTPDPYMNLQHESPVEFKLSDLPPANLIPPEVIEERERMREQKRFEAQMNQDAFRYDANASLEGNGTLDDTYGQYIDGTEGSNSAVALRRMQRIDLNMSNASMESTEESSFGSWGVQQTDSWDVQQTQTMAPSDYEAPPVELPKLPDNYVVSGQDFNGDAAMDYHPAGWEEEQKKKAWALERRRTEELANKTKAIAAEEAAAAARAETEQSQNDENSEIQNDEEQSQINYENDQSTFQTWTLN